MQTKRFVGIDISKDYFDVAIPQPDGSFKYYRFPQTPRGYRQFCKLLLPGDRCVMEATGRYNQRLAEYLHKAGYFVAVINPLRLRRYAQSGLVRTKTDKADARLIAQFGAQQPDLRPWQPPSEALQEARSLLTLLAALQKQLGIQRNLLHAFKAGGKVHAQALKSCRHSIRYFEKEIRELEKALIDLVRQTDPETYRLLCSICGIGPKTAAALIAYTRSFESFETANQVVAFAGLCPRTHHSGSSVRGRNAITKTGHPYLRCLLYNCAKSALQHNPQCRALHQRLTAKGKPSRKCVIAVAHKLLRQAFGVVKSQTPYDKNFQRAA